MLRAGCTDKTTSLARYAILATGEEKSVSVDV
jgi:hypothetical protein